MTHNHPFDGPEVFDDEINEHTLAEDFYGMDPWPSVTEAVKQLRAARA